MFLADGERMSRVVHDDSWVSQLKVPPNSSVAGQSGTLAKEFVGTKFAGQFFGKTGTLSVSKALSGYFPTATGTVEFALIVNVPEGSVQQANDVAKPIWALLPGTMSASPPGPSVDALAPGGS